MRGPARVDVAAADGEAVARCGAVQPLRQPVHRAGIGRREELAVARVAAEHDGVGAGHDALDVAAEQVLRLRLVVGALERADELVLQPPAAGGAPGGAVHHQQAAAEQQERGEDDEDDARPARPRGVAIGGGGDERPEERALGAEAVHELLALARAVDRERVRAGDADVADGLRGQGLPAGGDRGHLGELVADLDVVAVAPRDGEHALIGGAAALVRLEELARARLVVAADARLLVDHRGLQIGGGDDLRLAVEQLRALGVDVEPRRDAEDRDGGDEEEADADVERHGVSHIRRRSDTGS